ncbi:MAG: SUMF1/EgtB/PvdO family nonheme iron enzyme, partial [Candidatus Latescibacterota bacterium]
MGEWTYALVILFCTVVLAHVLTDYRRRLMRVMPGVEQVTSRKRSISEKISATESNAESIVRTLVDLTQEIETMDRRRKELQLQVNEREMVRISAGRFIMGSNLPGFDAENPERRVQLAGYYIDRYEVTNLQYKDFIDVTGHRLPLHWRNRTFPEGRLANHPVVNVSWHDAQAYAEWVGKRLPTEAEWERAARGDQGFEYPWGKSCTPDNANYGNPDTKTTPVDKFPSGRSQHGIYDMSGNVGEWVSDWFETKYYAKAPEVDPTGPEGGNRKVYRGGGYHCNKVDIR